MKHEKAAPCRALQQGAALLYPMGSREFSQRSVGADAYIGPLGSYEFAGDFRKNGAFCRVDVGIDPYNEMGSCLRIRRDFSMIRCIRRADRVVRTYGWYADQYARADWTVRWIRS